MYIKLYIKKQNAEGTVYTEHLYNLSSEEDENL